MIKTILAEGIMPTKHLIEYQKVNRKNPPRTIFI